MDNKIMDLWNEKSNEYFKDALSNLQPILHNPITAFPLAIRKYIKNWFFSESKPRICVPSSGDNFAAFAFHLLGARVTSCDISQNQLDNAQRIADMHGWDITFINSDSMLLSNIPDKKYDYVYTSNGVHVWISDLKMMYSNINRILQPEGRYIFFETHPMLRPFDDSGDEIKIKKHYDDILLRHGSIPYYMWRMKDFINALTTSGFNIRAMEEFCSSSQDHISYDYKYETISGRQADNGARYDWKLHPFAALPDCFMLAAEKG